jgi:hypothetical protein
VRSSWATSARNSRWRTSAGDPHVEVAPRDGLGAVGELADRPAKARGDAARQRPDQHAEAGDADAGQREQQPVRHPGVRVGPLQDDLDVAAARGRARLQVGDRVVPVDDLAGDVDHHAGVGDEARRLAGASRRARDAVAVDLARDRVGLLLQGRLHLGARLRLDDVAERLDPGHDDRQRHRDRDGHARADRVRAQAVEQPAHDGPGSSL